MELSPADFLVDSLTKRYGASTRLSPLQGSFLTHQFMDDTLDRILVNITLRQLESHPLAGSDTAASLASMELAGPRDKIFWDPANTRVAIVTCGGLAPGLNNVVQSMVTMLHDRYQVRNIFGVPFGYYGFAHDAESKRFKFPWRRLDTRSVQNIDFEAGSILGSARGHSDPSAIVDALVLRDVNIVFTIGGDGTLAGANAIYNEVTKRNLPIAVIGIPKTIDNDILWVSKSFGFETAVGKAVEALRCAQTEARGAVNGIGLVKIMGRQSGALTASAAAAMNDIDFVLIPEVELVLEGNDGFLNVLIRRVVEKGYATIAVAEGAGQNLFPDAGKETDASGNVKLKDIGRYLKEAIPAEFKRQGVETTLKYIDPSYMLRAQTTSSDDSVFCAALGQNAVHAAMAGKTGMMVGYSHEQFTNVPLKLVTRGRKKFDTNSPLWLSVLASTGQPAKFKFTVE
ncbi:MAG: ATP-dependent 6-phosphofructokinase [Silvanigrellaceae bacterium]